ncbi:hypothetical protein JTE90_026014 [Oedothorax gibbosus]|uniref:Kelch-like protein diablo n=1 Tax=Oedothorax gibbosus TaxID=931172 RepID=A0AAV6U3F8_9ARAC|nr:hypothetical protein JTE90_026014 [Oedothorax gibbosus]
MADSHKAKMDIFKEMLDNEEFTNLTLETEDGGRFKVHLEVMFAKSHYINRLLEEASEDIMEEAITIPRISKDTLNAIIYFIYTQNLSVKDENVQNLNDAAQQLGISDVVQLCKLRMEKNLTVENCLFRYTFADKNGYIDLKEVTKMFIIANFEKVQGRDDFCNLYFEDLKSILIRDSLNVKEEKTVYYALMKWVITDQSNRAIYLPALLMAVRIGLCDFTFFNELVCLNPLIISNEECHTFMYHARQLFADMQQSNGDQVMAPFNASHPFLRPRVPHEIIFAMGGWSSGSATNVMETYDCKTKRWFFTTADNFPRAYHGMVWHQGKIYMVGGFDGQQYFNSVRSFDPVTHTWEECGCMHVQRCYVSCVSLGNYVYAMGGYNGRFRNKSCERFDPATNQWTLIASMNAVRSDASADVNEGKIYITGGFDGEQVLNSTELYDPDTNEWTLIRHMHNPRSGVRVVAHHSHIYAIGGFNGVNRLATVERLDIHINDTMWHDVAPMMGPRSNFAAAIVDDCIYVVGGFNGLSTISSAEMYDPSTNTWSAVTDLNLNRSALAACTVFNIPTASEYTFLGMYN